MELMPADEFRDLAILLITERLIELDKIAQPWRDIKKDRKLDRRELKKYEMITDIIATNRSILYSLKFNPEHIMQ